MISLFTLTIALGNQALAILRDTSYASAWNFKLGNTYDAALKYSQFACGNEIRHRRTCVGTPMQGLPQCQE